eukprot:7384923-Prymnesium_polylepis.1
MGADASSALRASRSETSPDSNVLLSRSIVAVRHAWASCVRASSLASRSSRRATCRSGRARWPRRRFTLIMEPRAAPRGRVLRSATRRPAVCSCHSGPCGTSATALPSAAATSKVCAPRRRPMALRIALERAHHAALYAARSRGTATVASMKVTAVPTQETVLWTSVLKLRRFEWRCGRSGSSSAAAAAAFSAADRARPAAAAAVCFRRPSSTHCRKCWMAASAALGVVHRF